MSVSFLTSTCSEPARDDIAFGLCDDQNGSKAYSDASDDSKWVAHVINKQGQQVVFTPIDACIIVFKSNGKDKESTCDGMLTSQSCLYLVELKDYKGGGGWKSVAISQLENTMKLLLANHDLSHFKYKKGFACNKGSKSFQVLDNEQNLRFFRTYGFRLDSQSDIEIK